MALKRFDDLIPTAQLVAIAWWRQAYERLIQITQDESIPPVFMSTTANLSDAVVANEIVTDGQGRGFLWNDDGSPGYE